MGHIAGVKTFKVGSKVYTLRADFKAVAAIEAEFNDGVNNVVKMISLGCKVSAMAVVIYYLLQAEHKDDATVDDIEKVGGLIMDHSAIDMMVLMRECLYFALNPNDPDAKKDGKVGKQPTEMETKG